jgi:hypothetical protein
MGKLSRRSCLGLWLAAFGLAGAQAGTLPAPDGKVILRVTGNVANPNGVDGAEFDLSTLEQLGVVDLTTHTPWTQGEVRFTGVPLSRVLDAVGASGTTLDAVAINDYQISIPVDDPRRYPVLLATRLAGQPLRVRDKGPIWLIYPWTDHPEIDDEEHHARSIWQLKALVAH